MTERLKEFSGEDEISSLERRMAPGPISSHSVF
jgi:hypothetical protein